MTVVAEITTTLHAVADPGQWVTLAVRDTETRLARALASQDVTLAVETKIAAEDVHVCAMRNRMPREVQLRAAAAVRLSERYIALTIRAGQDAGKIARQGDNRGILQSPCDLVGCADLTDFYALADDVTDAEFTAAIEASITERNLARAHVFRKIDAARAAAPADLGGWIPDPMDRSTAASVRRRQVISDLAASGHSSRQISGQIKTGEASVRRIAREMGVVIHADQVVTRTSRGHAPARAAEETIASLEGLAAAVDLIDVDGLELSPAQARNWSESLTTSLQVLSQFAKQIKEMQ